MIGMIHSKKWEEKLRRQRNKKTPTVPKKPEADFMALVTAHQRVHGGTKTDSMLAIMNKFPKAHRDYLKKANPHKTWI